MIDIKEDRCWPEDYANGHNQYLCSCVSCLAPFYGHKRREICRVCAKENSELSIEEKLRDAASGHPFATVKWPHRVLHDAADEITRLRAERDAAFLAGVKAGLEAAKGVAIAYDGKPIRAASGWGHEQRDYHEAGQLDASASISSAIAAIDPATIKPVTEGADG